MAKARIDKVLVTNQTVLKAKYGASYASAIKPAIDGLIKADKARGLNTVLVPLDNAAGMKKFKGKAVTKPADQRQNKAAIDAVYKSATPSYICILGSVDVVPHQDLNNPISSDGDAVVPSDLPYACDHAYSKKIDDFLKPMRVVGRLPDITGSSDSTYLTSLLNTAATVTSLPRQQYENYLGLTAKVWHASTRQSLQNVFGNSSSLQDIPPKGPPWTGLIDRLSHFINCHGAPADSHFYGQQGNSFPVAHAANQLAGLTTGTVVAAECCYGAELYNPTAAGGQAGICNTYLKSGAHGFFGSSTIAYGPASGNGQADLVCQFFLKQVLQGASLGEAALLARLDFIKVLTLADPTDLKTLAQFNLMGDPSLHPVQSVPAEHTVVLAKSTKALPSAASTAEPAAVFAASRSLRRNHLAALGQMLGSAMACVATDSKKVAKGGVKFLLEAELAKENAVVQEVSTFDVRQPKGPAAKGFAMGLALAGAAIDTVHIAVGKLPREEASFDRYVVIVAREQEHQLLLRSLYSR